MYIQVDSQTANISTSVIWENVLVEVRTFNGAIIQAFEKCLVLGGHVD